MDKVNGSKTRFSNWKMIYRITRDVVEHPEFDDPARIVLVSVLVVQAEVRAIEKIQDIFDVPTILRPFFELLRGFSRQVLEGFFDFLVDNFLYEISYTLKRKGISLQDLDTRV